MKGTTNYTNLTNGQGILRLAPRMVANLVPLCTTSLRVIANAVKQSREKAYGKQLIWIASFLANRRFDNAKRVNDAKRVKRQRQYNLCPFRRLRLKFSQTNLCN